MHLHLPYVAELLAGVIGMLLSDGCGTFLVVAEARGRATLAGACDALGDLASVLVTVAGVGSILTDGLTWQSGSVLAAILITSFLGTRYWTGKANKYVKLDALENR